MSSVLPVQAAAAVDALAELRVEVGEKVIYCAAKLNVDASMLRLPMQDGIVVTTQWHVNVGKLRQYWLNENIAAIVVVRRVEADLLTRSWLLVDVSSGISLRVHDINLAVDFLTNLRRFPALDRSLLVAATVYRVSVNVDVLVGSDKKAWWADLWPSQETSMQKDFTLP